MREILFRGKAANRQEGRPYRTTYKNGDWVFGLLTDPLNYAGFAEMTNTNRVQGIEVDSNTVGQFTGFYDSTKWEDLTPEEQQTFLNQPDGWKNTPDLWHGQPIFDGDILEFANKDGSVARYEVKWGDVMGAWLAKWTEGAGGINIGIACELMVVVGNIHDNPELLEVK